MYTLLEETGESLENPYHQVAMLGGGFLYYIRMANNEIFFTYIISETITSIHKLPAGAPMQTAWVHLYIEY